VCHGGLGGGQAALGERFVDIAALVFTYSTDGRSIHTVPPQPLSFFIAEQQCLHGGCFRQNNVHAPAGAAVKQHRLGKAIDGVTDLLDLLRVASLQAARDGQIEVYHAQILHH